MCLTKMDSRNLNYKKYLCILVSLIIQFSYGLVNAQSTNQQSNSFRSDKTFTNAIGMEFVLIPAGSFLMGSAKKGGTGSQFPQHKVIISKPFYMSKYPVTVGEYRQFVNATDYKTEGENGGGSWVWTDETQWVQKADASWENPYFPQNDSHPVVCISWNDAQAFVEWLKTKENKNYRLPSEAEFEYALRAGTTNNYFFENDTVNFSMYGWPQELTSQGFPTHPVGAKLPNPWGLYDMVGNAWQWCGDWYDSNYYSNSPEIDPKGPPNGDYKINRGGMGPDIVSWSSSMRDALPPNDDYSNQSFRVVLLVSELNSGIR